MANLSFNVDTTTLGDPIVKCLEHATGAITLMPDAPAPVVETVATAPAAPKRVHTKAPSAVVAAPVAPAPIPELAPAETPKRRGRPKAAAKPETVGASAADPVSAPAATSAADPVPAPAATKQRRSKDELYADTKLVANALSQVGVDGASCEELRGHLAWPQDKTPALRNITASLIERGDVYKTGERRSTRYFLTAPTNGAGHATAEA